MDIATSITERIDLAFSNKLMQSPRFKNIYLNLFPNEYIYKIALIPLEINYSQFAIIKNKKDGRKFLEIKKEISKKIGDHIVSSAEKAAQLGAKLIIFNELSYPSIEFTNLNKILHKICNEKDCFIICGSFHNIEGKNQGFNKSILFSPFLDQDLYQLKNTRGFFCGQAEEINVPNEKYFNIFKTKYGSFIIAIGTDILDQNLEWNVRLLNRPNSLYAPIDLVISPCYTDQPNVFSQHCRFFSRSTNSCVIFVNDVSYGDESSIFMCGKRLDVSSVIENSGIKINLYDIDLASLIKARSLAPFFEVLGKL